MAKILVVEDERVAAWSIQESLEGFGHTIVASVVSGAEAIQTAESTHPDLVLMDIQLKGQIDGIAAAEQIRSQLRIPIVYLTAHADHSTLSRAIATEAFGYLVKPFNQTELHTTIEIALLRNQFEKRLEAIEQRLSTTLISIGDGTIATDRNGQVVFMNPVAEDLTGWQQSEALGQYADSILDLVDAETGESVEESPIMQAIQEGKRVSLPERYLLRARDGSERAVGDTAAPIRDATGEVTGGIVVFQDISDRKQIEADLERQVRERTAQLQQALDFEALLKRITDKVRDSLDESHILQTAVQELAVELKTSCCDTGLYDLDAGVSTIAYECLQTDDLPSSKGKICHMEDCQQIYRKLQKGQALQFCWIITPNRPIRYSPKRFASLACPLIDDKGVIGDMWLYRPHEAAFEAAEIRLVQQVANQCAIALRQARLYKAAQSQVSELERLNQLKDDFLNTISHELRTPIASIKMASQMLEIRLRGLGLLETDAEQTGRYLQILQNECDREINLINNMLDLSRLDAQMEPISQTPISLQDWILHLLEPFTTKMQKQQQHLVVDIPADLSPIVSDLSSLGRILTELLNNAFKYTPAQETIKVSARLETRTPQDIRQEIQQAALLKDSPPPQNGNRSEFLDKASLTLPTQSLKTYCAIRVSNSGVEISPSEQALIFDKFYRIPNTDPWRHGGTGLGLALVKRLVNHIQGEIGVVSEKGWTTFTIYLPL
ncbi:MAG: response regulator [Oculatellaceae cyanobacterium Prado106]|jgi:PAS domain S-box-containing protein|nr:response regulator [Oculatellaceae cyanobacterium Prado106]